MRVCCVTSIKLFDTDIPFIIHKIKLIMTGATNGARPSHPAGEHDLIPVLVVFFVLLDLWISVYYLSMIICLFVFFYFWLLH